MAIPASLLGVLPHAAPIVPWIIEQAAPAINEWKSTYGGDVMTMAADKLVRLGDLVVWEGDTGRQVVAGLANLGDSQQRIETAVSAIESTQLSMAGTLGIVQSVTMTTFGVTSLSAGFMMWRLKALDKRLNTLATQIADIEARLDARDQGLLDSSLTYLNDYDRHQRPGDLEFALERARDSANTFGNLVDDECNGRRRLPVLNYRGRRYLLSLLTELQCSILRGDAEQTIHRVQNQQPRLQLLVEANFRQTLALDPEQYLHPALSDSGVTIELLTDLYRQLQNAKVVADIEIRDAADLFEHLRQRIYRKSWLKLPQVRDWRKPLLERLRYLIAAVEDVNRVESLRLLVDHAHKTGESIVDLRHQIHDWIKDMSATPGANYENATFAYRFT